MTATLRTLTLGCRVNQYETEFVRQALEQIGYADAAEGQPADLCLVNTCTVTAEGDAKGRQAIRRLARENPGARLVVMGCYATRAPDEVRRLPGVSEVLVDKRELPDWLARAGVVDVPTGLRRFDGRQRAYVKVQDGCMLDCAYCIIPAVRPGLRSRPPEHIEAEIGRLVAHGHREVVLTGIHLGHYGVEWSRGRPRAEWLRLAQLVERLARLDGPFRLRLSSIECTEVTRDLIGVLARHPRRVCPHLHVALQSGSDHVLRRMRRRWGARRCVDRCQLVRDSLDRPALSTDVIVGFPGETEADFADTCRVVEALEFARVHVFPFSPRQGTPAAALPAQVRAEVKQARAAELARLAERVAAGYRRRLDGMRLDVLVEGTRPERPDVALGTACRYVPVELPAAVFPGGRLPERSQRVEVLVRAGTDGTLAAAAVC